MRTVNSIFTETSKGRLTVCRHHWHGLQLHSTSFNFFLHHVKDCWVLALYTWEVKKKAYFVTFEWHLIFHTFEHCIQSFQHYLAFWWESLQTLWISWHRPSSSSGCSSCWWPRAGQWVGDNLYQWYSPPPAGRCAGLSRARRCTQPGTSSAWEGISFKSEEEQIKALIAL